MIPALEHIIHPDQRGFMQERRISVNIRKMLDIIHIAEKEDLEAIIMSLDFVKCFDKCSFKILHGSLEYFGFGDIVKSWTYILYKNFHVKIQNNGHFSSEISIEKGVHQGGCCSSIYFLVIAEILAITLRADENIQGITIALVKNLLNQFADDMDSFLTADRKTVMSMVNQLERFRQQSGFMVSYEKTTMYRIGSLRHSNAQMYDLTQFNWSNDHITVLGITITQEDLVEKNYDSIEKKVRKTLNSWVNRGLSLVGKVLVVNSLVASLFVYKMMVLPRMPKKVIKCVDNVIREFLWDKKKAKIAYTTLQNPKKEGGLNLVCLEKKETALKATWPQILYKEKEYAQIVYYSMKCSIIGEEIWRCTLSCQDAMSLKISNSFWKDVLVSWCEYNFYQNREVSNQIFVVQ